MTVRRAARVLDPPPWPPVPTAGAPSGWSIAVAAPATVRGGHPEGRSDRERPGYLAIAAHITGLLGGLVDPRVVRAVIGLTGGELDAVTEVVRDAKDTGCLVRGPEAWQQVAPLPTRRLVALVGDRLAGLPAPLQTDARLLALGSPLSIRTAGTVLAPRHVRALEARGIARFRCDEGERQVVIADAIHREAVLTDVDDEERLRLLQRLADAVERGGPTGTDLLRVARWRLEVGGWPAERFEVAAGHAYTASETGLAARLAARAVEQGAGCRGAVMRAVTLAAHGEVDAAAHAERLAHRAARGHRDRVRVAIAGAHRAAIGNGRWRRAAGELLAEADTLPPGPSVEHARAYAALLHAFDADPCAVERTLRERDDDVETPREARIVSEVAVAFAAAARLDRPRVKRAVAVVEQLSAGDTETPQLAVELVRGIGLFAGDGRPPQDRLRSATAALDRVYGAPEPVVAWWLAVNGRLHLSGGELEAARGRFTEALLLTEASDPIRLRPRLTADLALVAALGGVPAEAERLLATLVDERRVSTAIEVRCELAEVVVAAQYEGPAAATPLALACGDRAVVSGRLADAVLAWHLTARLGDGELAAERLAGGRPLPDHPAATLARRHVEALAAADDEALLAVARDLARTGRYLGAAEAATQAATIGGTPQARALAGGLAAACADVRSPTLDGIERVVLSPRRQEVARAAILGASGPEIAEELGRSLRTVNNHLAEVYRRLGVRNRTELSAVYRIDRRPLVDGDAS